MIILTIRRWYGLFLVLIAAALPQVAVADEAMTDEDDVLIVNEAFYEAYQRQDIDSLAAIWADEPYIQTVHAFGEPHLVGREEVLASWQALFDRVDDIDVTFTEPRVTIDGNVAWVTGQEFAEVSESGGEPFTVSLAVTRIFEKIDGRWQLVLHHVTELTNTSEG